MKFFKKRLKIKTRKDHSAQTLIPFRLNVIFFVVFILFSALIIQLAHLQIIDGKKFAAEAATSDVTIERRDVPRGMIYDSTGKILAANNSSRAITYTRPLLISNQQMYEIANHLTHFITVNTKRLSLANKVDYYLAKPGVEQQIDKKIPNALKLKPATLYQKEYNYVVKHKLYDDLDSKGKQAALLFGKMSGAYALSTVYLKTSGVSDQEMADVGGHLSQLPGVEVGTSWSRSYPDGKGIQSLIGTVTTKQQGLPDDSINKLLAEGYSRNDSVGSSYIEKEYENTLKGSKEILNIETRKGKIVKEITKFGGQPGDNLVLTVNAKFQNQVQKIIKNTLAGSGNPYSPGAYAVVMNPNTGGIYALAGVARNIKTGKITENALGAINQSFVMGSVVKGATIMSGFKTGAITPTNSTIVDSPVKIAGTPPKGSWFNHGGTANIALTAPLALEVSSNAYMMKLAMKEAHFHYVPGGPLTMSPSIFNTLRSNFKQFGLGVPTGIDVPGEAIGFEGPGGRANIGKALDLSFGNYDSYTPIQLAQYISTIANGGYRLQPHVVQSINGTNPNGSLGSVKHVFAPNILNVVSATPAEWGAIKTGLYDVVHGTNVWKTGGALANIKPAIAAKTGTAQTFYKDKQTITLSAVSYAPYYDPQVVVVVAFPGLSQEDHLNLTAVEQIYKAYWKMVQSPKPFLNNK